LLMNQRSISAVLLVVFLASIGPAKCAPQDGGMDMDMHMDMSGGSLSTPPSTPKEHPPDSLENLPPLTAPAGVPSARTGYSLSDLQKLAIDNNPTLVQAKAQIAGERGKALQAGLFPNPDMAYVGDLIGERRAGLGEFQGGVLQQEIVLGGKLKYSRKKYQARASAAEQQARAQQLRVMNDVAITFYRTLAAAERLRIHQDFLRSARDSQITRREMFNTGEANEADLRAVDVALEKQKLEVQTAENDLQLAWQELTALVGIDGEYAALNGTLEESVAAVEWKASLQQILADSPELGEAKAKLRADQLTVQREHRQPVPNLVVAGGPGYDQLDNSFALIATASVTNIPVFNRNQGTIKQAEADLSRQRAQVRLVELQLRTRLAMMYRRYLTAQQHVDAYQAVIIPKSRERYEINLRSYANTRLDWPVVLESQRDFLSNKIAYIDNLLELRESSTEIQGLLLTGGLVPPPGVTPPGHIDATPQPR